MLRYSTIESLANDWDTPNSCVLKNSFERVDKKSIDDLSFVSTVTGCTNLFSDFFKFFLYLPGILKAFFVILWLISISHLMSQKFQNSLNWDLSFISRVFSVLWAHSVKAMLTLFALTIPSCSKRITAEILEDPSYIKMWIPIEMQVCFHGRKRCLDLEGLLIPSSNSLNKRTSYGPEVLYSLRPVGSGLFNRWVAPPSPFIFSLCSAHERNMVEDVKNFA